MLDELCAIVEMTPVLCGSNYPGRTGFFGRVAVKGPCIFRLMAAVVSVAAVYKIITISFDKCSKPYRLTISLKVGL